MEQQKKKEKRNDKILLVCMMVLAVVCGFFVWIYQKETTHHPIVVVRVNDVVIGSYPLEEDASIPIETKNHGYNLLVIKNGSARIMKASCPDKICVHHTSIRKNGQAIVCLPNKVVIEIESQEEDAIDMSTN